MPAQGGLDRLNPRLRHQLRPADQPVRYAPPQQVCPDSPAAALRMRVYMRLEELVFLGNLPPDIEAGDRGGDKPAVASAADRQCCQALAVMLPCIRDGDKRAHSDFIQELGKQVSGDATSFCPPTHTHTHTHTPAPAHAHVQQQQLGSRCA